MTDNDLEEQIENVFDTQSQRENRAEIVEEYTSLGKDNDIDFTRLHEASDGDLHKLFEAYNSRDAQQAKIRFDNISKGFLGDKVYEHMKEKHGGKANFSHLAGKERDDAIEDFIRMLMKTSVQQTYMNQGKSEEEAQQLAEDALSTPAGYEAWVGKIFRGSAYKEQFKSDLSNIFGRADAPDITNTYNHQLNDVYNRFTKMLDPHSDEKNMLDTELAHFRRKEGFEGYLNERLPEGASIISSALDGEHLVGLGKDVLREGGNSHQMLYANRGEIDGLDAQYEVSPYEAVGAPE